MYKTDHMLTRECRLSAIQSILEAYDGNPGPRLIETYPAIYAIPLLILEGLHQYQSWGKESLLNADEMVEEVRFARFCESKRIMGFAGFQPIRCDDLFHIFSNQQSSTFRNPTLQKKATKDQQVRRAMDNQQLAYRGWLNTNLVYCQERDELRNHWLENGAYSHLLGGRNLQRQWKTLRRKMDLSLVPKTSSAAKFRHFFLRWELDGIASWDLPTLLPPNLGGPVAINSMMETDKQPSIQKPAFMQLPKEWNVNDLLQSEEVGPLQAWLKISKNGYPQHYAYGFIIDFFETAVLGAVLSGRLHRKQEVLDEIISIACMNSRQHIVKGWKLETIQKHRQRYQRLKDDWIRNNESFMKCSK